MLDEKHISQTYQMLVDGVEDAEWVLKNFDAELKHYGITDKIQAVKTTYQEAVQVWRDKNLKERRDRLQSV